MVSMAELVTACHDDRGWLCGVISSRISEYRPSRTKPSLVVYGCQLPTVLHSQDGQTPHLGLPLTSKSSKPLSKLMRTSCLTYTDVIKLTIHALHFLIYSVFRHTTKYLPIWTKIKNSRLSEWDSISIKTIYMLIKIYLLTVTWKTGCKVRKCVQQWNGH